MQEWSRFEIMAIVTLAAIIWSVLWRVARIFPWYVGAMIFWVSVGWLVLDPTDPVTHPWRTFLPIAGIIAGAILNIGASRPHRLTA